MRRTTLLILLLILAAVFTQAQEKQFGKELTLAEKTDVKTLLEKPMEFEGKKVLVEGTIVDVCDMRGCWIDIAAAEGYEKIRVKVDDGVIVFPMEAKGKTALVEGEVYAVTPAHECSGDCAEKAKEDGHNCENETAKVYQIKGEGAVIKM